MQPRGFWALKYQLALKRAFVQSSYRFWIQAALWYAFACICYCKCYHKCYQCWEPWSYRIKPDTSTHFAGLGLNSHREWCRIPWIAFLLSLALIRVCQLFAFWLQGARVVQLFSSPIPYATYYSTGFEPVNGWLDAWDAWPFTFARHVRQDGQTLKSSCAIVPNACFLVCIHVFLEAASLKSTMKCCETWGLKMGVKGCWTCGKIPWQDPPGMRGICLHCIRLACSTSCTSIFSEQSCTSKHAVRLNQH